MATFNDSMIESFRANSGEALRMLALRGEGIVLEPRFIVADDLTAGRLVRLLGDYEPSPTMIHVVYPHSRLLPVKVRTFVEFLAARFTDQQDWERASEDRAAGRVKHFNMFDTWVQAAPAILDFLGS